MWASVATGNVGYAYRCAEMFNDQFIASFLENPSVKEL